MMRWLRLWWLRYEQQRVCEDLDWVLDNLRFAKVRAAELERRAYALQADVWALERPGKLIREAK